MADATTMTTGDAALGNTVGGTPATTNAFTGTGTGLSPLQSGLGALTSLYQLFGGGQGSIPGQTAAITQAADPFASQRGQYAAQLQGLMTNPASFTLSPAAQAQINQGSQNLSRQMAAQGFLGSGNILSALQQFGQQTAAQDYYNQLNELNLLSGAQTGSPSAAALGLSNMFGQQQQALQNLGGAMGSSGFGQLLNSLGGGLQGLIGEIGSLFGGGTGSLDLSNLQNLFSGTDSSGLTQGAIDQSLADFIGVGNTASSGFNLNNLGDASSVGSSATDFGLGTSGTDTSGFDFSNFTF